MILPLGFLIFLMVLGALVTFGGICSAYWLILWWWRDLMWARTLRRWEQWRGPEAYEYFQERIGYRAKKAYADSEGLSAEGRAMAVANAVYQFLTRNNSCTRRSKHDPTVEERT